MFSVDELKGRNGLQGADEQLPPDNEREILIGPAATVASRTFKGRPGGEVQTLRKITARTLANERSLAAILISRSEIQGLEPHEKEMLERHKSEFQKALLEAWGYFDTWKDRISMQSAEIDLVRNCVVAEPLPVLLICQLIKESCPALYYYASDKDGAELCRLISSLLLHRRITEEEFAAIKGISVVLPAHEDSRSEPWVLKSAKNLQSDLEQTVAVAIEQFIHDYLEEGSVTVKFHETSLSGACYSERYETLDSFLSKIGEQVSLMLQEKEKGFFLNLQNIYPFDPELIQNDLTAKIHDKMKLDGSAIEAATSLFGHSYDQAAFIAAKIAWLILSCLSRQPSQKRVNAFGAWLEERLLKKGERASIVVKRVEAVLQSGLNGMMTRVESALVIEGKNCSYELSLRSDFREDILLLPSGAETSLNDSDVYPSSHIVVVPLSCHLLQSLDRVAAPFAENEIIGRLGKMAGFLKWLSLVNAENQLSAGELLQQFYNLSDTQNELSKRSDRDSEALFVVEATHIVREGIAAFGKFREVIGNLQGGFSSSRALFRDLEIFFERSVAGLLLIKEKMLEIGWKGNPEGWFCLIDLLDGKLRGLVQRKKSPIVLSVPKKIRSYSELAWDVIYQSERAEDIDWKCQRYLELLRQLKNKCQLLGLHDKSGFFAKDSLSIQTRSITRQQLDALRTSFSETFLLGLRSKLTDDQIFAKGEISPYLKVAETLMTEMNLDQPALAMLDKFVSWGAALLGQEGTNLPKGTSASMVEGYEEIWKCLNAVPVGAKRPPIHQLASSARGRWNVDFDPIRQGNLPQLLGKLQFKVDGVDVAVKALAFGSPTIEGAFSYAVLNPEFQACMAIYQATGKSHLFVLNQNQIPAWRILGEVETDRIDAINSFAEQKVPDALYVLVLSKNSPFYYQTGEFAGMCSAALFKDAFVKQLFDLPKTVTGNSFSANLLKKVPDVRERTIEMIEAVHQYLFMGEGLLEKEERILFIDTVQSMLTLLLIMELGVVSFNISCKDAIDRAIVSYALLLALVALVSGKNQDREFRRKFFMVVFARALMVRKRPIFFDRLERILSGVRGFEKKAEHLAQVFEVIFKGCSVRFEDSL
ncbi:hypothetical protein [Estrella lausannensis]|uniref:Uncharacterized protein n=1 Tax=Estrella lausannensis TaxID=483423 RepID=A0A0H5DPY6_9BACT|nr:hypothetical protein [Estrella lausannensis]CRX38557.1 hypothetical protein ELAC_1216 [Estrella lausannensis]